MFENMTPDRFKGLENFRDQHSKKIAEESLVRVWQVVLITSAALVSCVIQCWRQRNDMSVEAAIACQAVMVGFAIFFRRCLNKDSAYLSNEIQDVRCKMGIIIERLSGPLDRHIIREEMGIDINAMTSAAIPMNYEKDREPSSSGSMRHMIMETGRHIAASIALFF